LKANAGGRNAVRFEELKIIFSQFEKILICDLMSNFNCILINKSTVKPVYNNHPRDPTGGAFLLAQVLLFLSTLLQCKPLLFTQLKNAT